MSSRRPASSWAGPAWAFRYRALTSSSAPPSGVGTVNRSTNWGLMKPIALAWVITLSSAAILGSVGLIALRAVF